MVVEPFDENKISPDEMCIRDSYGDVRTGDVTVRRLREKIEDDPSMPKYIITKRGVGYYVNK